MASQPPSSRDAPDEQPTERSQLGANEIALTAHLVRPREDDHDAFIDATVHALNHRFGINHATLQIERGAGCGHGLHDAAPHHSR